jgi:propionyl-CoA carboxylase alpha chain
MPGSVVRVHAAVGEAVDAGDPVVTLEAMKMEHVVVAPSAGQVSEIGVAPGRQVARGDVVAVIEA